MLSLTLDFASTGAMVGEKRRELLSLLLVIVMVAVTGSNSVENGTTESISNAATPLDQTSKVPQVNDYKETIHPKSGNNASAIADSKLEQTENVSEAEPSDVNLSTQKDGNAGDRVSVPEKSVGPTVPQIAQARRLLLAEGDEGDASPTSLQAADSEPGSAEGTRDNFLFRLTNKSFLDSFSQLRNLTDLPATSSPPFITPVLGATTPSSVQGALTSFSNTSTLADDAEGAEGADDDMLIQDTRLLLSQMLAKKTGFAYNHSFLHELQDSDYDYPLLQESQLAETRLPAPAPYCKPGRGRCRSLRERLQQDLATSYNEPFPSRIRYRLKKKPSVYTTKKPRSSFDIGVPDIYETEVDVTSQEGHPGPFQHPRLPDHDHRLAADSDRQTVVTPKRPLQSVGAIRSNKRNQKPASSQKTTKKRGHTSAKPSNGRRRTGSTGVRNLPSLLGYGRPRRIHSKTHLDYRRPVSFKFKRMNHIKEAKKSGGYGGIDDKYTSKEKDGPLRSTHTNSFLPINHNSQHPRAQLENIRNGQNLRKRPGKRRRKNKNQPEHSETDNSYGPANIDAGYTSPKPPGNYESASKTPTHYGAPKEEVAPYEAVSATTSASVFYKQSIHDYQPHTVAPDYNAHKPSSPSYNAPQPPSDYLPPKSSHTNPHHLPPGHAGMKSATVPGWLMDLKSEPRHPTPPRKYHPTSNERLQMFPSSSPRPSDYALKASKPSSLQQGYPKHHTPELKYESPKPEPEPSYEAPKESYKEPKVEYQSPSNETPGPSYGASKPHQGGSAPHIPNHFQIIKPSLAHPVSSYRVPPPPHLHVPLEQEYLPATKEYKPPPQGTTPKSDAIPHYPVIPSPDGYGGAKYSVKVSTPSGIYITPVRVSPNSDYKPPQTLLPIYAPPTSPRPTYGPPTTPRYPASISGKPHHLTASYEAPPTAPQDPHPHKVHVGHPELGVTEKFVLKISPQPTPKYSPPKTDYDAPEQKADYPSVTMKKPSPALYVPPPNAPQSKPNDYQPPKLSAGVHVTTFKPQLPKQELSNIKEINYPTGEQISKKPHVEASTYTPPVHTPNPVALPGFGSEDHRLTTLTASSPQGISPSHVVLPYFLDDDYYNYDDYYYDDDYYDYYDDYYYYDDDDYYDFDYYPDIREAAESRPPIPHHLIPKSNYDIPENQIQDFGYIAGIPGRAGRDYPILSYIPYTSFGCGLVADYPGYYADMEAGCQVFHVCHHDGRQDSFLCPNGTVFNQKYFVCDWWYNFNCEDAPFFYPVNAAIGQPGAALHTNQYERERHLYGSSSNSIRNSRNVHSHVQSNAVSTVYRTQRPSPRLSQGGGRRGHGSRYGSPSIPNHYVSVVNQIQKFPFPSSPRLRRPAAQGPSNATQPTQTRRRLQPTGQGPPHRQRTQVTGGVGHEAQDSGVPSRPPTTGLRKRSPSHFLPTPLPRLDPQPPSRTRIRRNHAYS